MTGSAGSESVGLLAGGETGGAGKPGTLKPVLEAPVWGKNAA